MCGVLMAARSTVLVLSGGLDSSTLLYHLLAQGDVVRAMSVHYGQRHAREIDAAKELCRRRGVEHQTADLRTITGFLGKNSLSDTSVPVPDGHYEQESMKITIVPNRNMIMLSVAIGWAVSLQADAVAYGAHAGDHAIYPDCRPEFAAAMAEAARLCDWHQIELLRPFVGMSKKEIVQRGAELGVPLELTWSCYKGGTVHCGTCGTCVERKEAFELAGVKDPTVYAG